MSDPRISIVIPAFNSQKTIAETLRAVLNQSIARSFEVIVVDDGSTDKTAEIVQSFAHVKYIWQPNAGPASARNHGISESRGEFIYFTDSDCRPKHDCLQLVMNHFSDSNIAVVCGSYGISNPENMLASCIHVEILFRHNVLIPNFPKYFGSFNFCARRKILLDLGGFNSAYRHPSGEDNDLSYKILSAGYKIFFERKALVDHYHTENVWKYLKEQYRHGYWRAKMYYDHPSMMVGDDYTFWKDMVEVPLVVASVSALFTGFLALKILLAFSLFSLFFLILMELFFALMILNDLRKGLFYGAVMFLRAFTRTLGFLTGIVCFFPRRVQKKIQ